MRRLVPALLTVAALATACKPQPATLSDADVAAIRQLGQSYASAVLKSDAAGVAALYADNAVEMPSDLPVRVGKAAIQAGYVGGMGATAFTLTSGQIDGRADLAYDRGTWSWTGTPPGKTTPVSQTGKYLTIARRQADGSWRWTQVIWNSDAPETPVQ